MVVPSCPVWRVKINISANTCSHLFVLLDDWKRRLAQSRWTTASEGDNPVFQIHRGLGDEGEARGRVETLLTDHEPGLLGLGRKLFHQSVLEVQHTERPADFLLRGDDCEMLQGSAVDFDMNRLSVPSRCGQRHVSVHHLRACVISVVNFLLKKRCSAATGNVGRHLRNKLNTEHVFHTKVIPVKSPEGIVTAEPKYLRSPPLGIREVCTYGQATISLGNACESGVPFTFID